MANAYRVCTCEYKLLYDKGIMWLNKDWYDLLLVLLGTTYPLISEVCPSVQTVYELVGAAGGLLAGA